MYSADLNYSDKMNKTLICKRVFSQIGLRLNINSGNNICLNFIRINIVHFSPETLNQNFSSKMGHFGFLKNYAKALMVIDDKFISQKDAYTSQ